MKDKNVGKYAIVMADPTVLPTSESHNAEQDIWWHDWDIGDLVTITKSYKDAYVTRRIGEDYTQELPKQYLWIL